LSELSLESASASISLELLEDFAFRVGAFFLLFLAAFLTGCLTIFFDFLVLLFFSCLFFFFFAGFSDGGEEQEEDEDGGLFGGGDEELDLFAFRRFLAFSSSFDSVLPFCPKVRFFSSAATAACLPASADFVSLLSSRAALRLALFEAERLSAFASFDRIPSDESGLLDASSDALTSRLLSLLCSLTLDAVFALCDAVALAA